MRSTIQCSRDHVIIEFGGFPSNGSRLFGILRQDIIQCIVDVWESPIPGLWTCEVSRVFWLDSLLSAFDDLQKRLLGNTSRGCRQVFFSTTPAGRAKEATRDASASACAFLLAWYMVDVNF